MKLQRTINGVEFYGETPEIASTKDMMLTVSADKNKEPENFLFHSFSENSLKKYLHVTKDQKIKSLLIWNMSGNAHKYDLSLINLENLEGFFIDSQKTDEIIIGPHQTIDNLKSLSIRSNVPVNFLELSIFPKISKLMIDAKGPDARDLIEKCSNVKDCIIYGLDIVNLDIFSRHRSLLRLCISEGGIKTLNGLSKIENLETLHVVAAKYLSNVDDLILAKNLKNIMFEKYKKITNWDFLAKKNNWNTIWIEVAESIDFIKSLPNTKYFFCNKVLDKRKDNGKLFKLENGASLFSFFYGDLLE